jgi:hypothetical protein
MPVINVRRVGQLPFSVASYHMIPTINPGAAAAAQGAFSTLQQQTQQAQATCAQFTTAAENAACMEAVQSPDAASLTPDQLALLVHGKVQCHAFFDANGVAAPDAMMDQCILNPAAFIDQAHKALGQPPGDSAAAPGFFSTYKVPIIGGGVLLAALVLWKVVT